MQHRFDLSSQSHCGWRLAAIPVLALVAVLIFTAPGLAAPRQQGVIHHVYTTSVKDVSFVVSWTTDSASNGAVDYGTSIPPGSTKTDSVASTTTHYVIITGLSPNTTYYFQVRSGSLTDNNGGAYYSVVTGPTLSSPCPAGFNVWGYVYQSNGTTVVPNAVVYLQLQDNNGSGSPGNSQWASVRSDNSGIWYSNLGDIRTNDLSACFTFSNGTDNLRIVTQGGDKGVIGENGAERIVPVPTTYPAQFDTILDNTPNAVTLTRLAAGQQRTISVGLPVLVAALVGTGGLLFWRRGKQARRV